MANGGATVDRLRDYLRDLPAQSRAVLIVELERQLLRGEDAAGADIVLAELRRLFRESREVAPRYGNAARQFFTPLEPFLVDDQTARHHSARIARAALDPLWVWIRRDLLPAEAQDFTEAVWQSLLANDVARTDALTRVFQDKVAGAIERSFADATDDKAQRRLIAQIGTPRAADDARNLMRVLKMRDALAMLADHLPGYIAALADNRLSETKALIAAAAAQNPDIIPYAILIVMRRLAAPWQLIRLAPKSPDVSSNREQSTAVAVSIVLAELARLTDELRSDLTHGGVATIALLQAIHDGARGLRLELDPAPESVWGRELAGLRAQISSLLQSEIESAPGRVRRLLRARPSAEIRANSTLDAGDVAETEALIALVGACRNFAGELALNEMTQRSYSELQQYLDGCSGTLLDALRHAGENDRIFRQSQADAAVRFCRKVFGADYAAMLTKAAEVAGTPDRAGGQRGV